MLSIIQLEQQIARLKYQLQYNPKLVVQTKNGMHTELTELKDYGKTIIRSYIMSIKQELAERKEEGEFLVVS